MLQSYKAIFRPIRRNENNNNNNDKTVLQVVKKMYIRTLYGVSSEVDRSVVLDRCKYFI